MKKFILLVTLLFSFATNLAASDTERICGIDAAVKLKDGHKACLSAKYWEKDSAEYSTIQKPIKQIKVDRYARYKKISGSSKILTIKEIKESIPLFTLNNGITIFKVNEKNYGIDKRIYHKIYTK